MKYLLTLICALFIGGTATAQATQDFNCDAEPSPEALEYLRRTHSQRLTHLEENGARSRKVVKVAIHIIRTTAGGSGMSEAGIASRLATANTRYEDANIVLEQCGPYNYIDNSTYSTFNKTVDETIRTANDVPGAINIYFANSVLNASGTSICGYAKFPTAATSSSGTNFTVIQNSCNESTFVHELGHCFGLLHTHSTSGGAELVDRSASGNCATAGDGFCDTPADPTLSNSLVNTSCVYTGTATDSDGDTYAPDPNNIMSYSRKTCRTAFSPSQLSSVNYSANNDYVLSRCGGGDIFCTSYLGLYPYNQGFEGGSLPGGWAQGTDDDRDWSIRSGSTTSLNTGPTAAHGGSYYYYTESSGSGIGFPDKTFSLLGPCFNTLNSSTSYVTFNYHMYGATTGSLELQLSLDEGNTWTTLWTKSGDQGNSWKYQFLSLNGYLDQPSMRLRFFATTGSSFTSDIAIDDITIYRNTLSGYAKLPYVDGFEGGSFGSYWTTSSTNAFGRVQVTNANQPGGEYHATMDVNTNNNYATNRMDLGVRLFFETDVELSFDWKEFNDENHSADGVYLSTNGGSSWTKIYNLTAGSSTYQRVTLNLNDIASTYGLSLSNTSKIRWQQYDNYSIGTDGIAIDNVLITSSSSDPADLSELSTQSAESGPLPEALMEGVEFYPNPFTGHMNIRIPDGYGPIVQLSVFDVSGKAVYQANDLAEGRVFQMGHDFAPGIYMVRVQTQGTVETFKAVKTQ